MNKKNTAASEYMYNYVILEECKSKKNTQIFTAVKNSILRPTTL